MYDRSQKRFRLFTVRYGPDGIGETCIRARSNLEAGVIFVSEYIGQVMWSVEE